MKKILSRNRKFFSAHLWWDYLLLTWNWVFLFVISFSVIVFRLNMLLIHVRRYIMKVSCCPNTQRYVGQHAIVFKTQKCLSFQHFFRCAQVQFRHWFQSKYRYFSFLHNLITENMRFISNGCSIRSVLSFLVYFLKRGMKRLEPCHLNSCNVWFLKTLDLL